MKRRLAKGQILGLCIVGVLLLAVIGLLCYDYFILKTVEKEHILSAGLITASLILTTVRLLSRGAAKGENRKRAYKEAYGEHIRSAFADRKKEEKMLYDVFEDYNTGRYAKALEKLDRLSAVAKNADERYAVAFFRALCLDSMRLYEQAIAQYEKAINVRANVSAYSNMGICLNHLGRVNEAIEAYLMAAELDQRDPAPLANLASLYIGETDYETALEYAQRANAIDAKYPTALSAQAICYAMMENEEKYKEYYQRAAAVGYNTERLKRFIESLKNG